jgi:hypothetical protein
MHAPATNEVIVGFERPVALHGGRTIHVLDANGNLLRAIGAAETIRTGAAAPLQVRVFGFARSADLFWATRALSSVLELMDTRGRVHKRVLLAEAVVPFAAPGPNEKVAPRPRIMAIREDSVGRLWLWYSRPNPSFRSPSGSHYRLEDLVDSILPVRNATETVLQVIDVDQGRVLAETVEVMPYLFLGRDLFIKTTGTAEALTLSIIRVQLEGLPRG